MSFFKDYFLRTSPQTSSTIVTSCGPGLRRLIGWIHRITRFLCTLLYHSFDVCDIVPRKNYWICFKFSIVVDTFDADLFRYTFLLSYLLSPISQSGHNRLQRGHGPAFSDQSFPCGVQMTSGGTCLAVAHPWPASNDQSTLLKAAIFRSRQHGLIPCKL